MKSRFFAGVGALVVMVVAVATAVAFIPTREASAVTYQPVTQVDVTSMRGDIQNLKDRVSTLEARVRNLEAAPQYRSASTIQPTGPYSNPYQVPQTTVVPMAGPVVIDQNGGFYQAGWDIYFTGRGFGAYEQVLIFEDGVAVSQIGTDAAGNFRANGIPLTLGTHTFTFTGQSTAASGAATVRGVQDVIHPYAYGSGSAGIFYPYDSGIRQSFIY